MFQFGTNEAIVGRAARTAVRRGSIVGSRFKSGRTTLDGRRHLRDRRQRGRDRDLVRRAACCRASTAAATPISPCWRGSIRPTRSTRFKDWLTTNPQLNVQVRRENEYYAAQSTTHDDADSRRSASPSPR